jgi:Cu/Ag efflux protein CusF
MRTMQAVACSMVLAMLAWPAHAQTDATATGSRPGAAGALRTVQATATITSIDPATREVTLKRTDGREVTLVAGDEVRNFDQIKVGDQVSTEYVEALTLELKKGGGQAVARTEQVQGDRAKPGERPSGAAGRTVKIVADVVAVDPSTQSVTLKGPQRTVDVKVADPEQFKLIQVGDQVEATYTQALALSVQAAPK